jgi:predicted nucleic acid-binding protein
MPGFSPDTSCMVAAVCGWHESHLAAREAIERRLRQADTMLVAGPALVEAYAVLTRLPPPHRLSASDAVALLDANFIALGRVVTTIATLGTPHDVTLQEIRIECFFPVDDATALAFQAWAAAGRVS